MKTYEVSSASVSSITSVSEISSSTRENPRRVFPILWRPANIVVIAESLFAEVGRDGAVEGHAVFRPGHGEGDTNLSERARSGCGQRREASGQREARREGRGESLAGEHAGKVHGLGLRRVI